MTEYTAEIIKIEFGHLLSAMSAWMPALEGISKSNMEANAATSQVAQNISEWNLPGQFELLTAQLSEAFSLQQETMQALLEWDMLTQMETLNTNIIDNFTLQNESITALAEGMKEYLAEAFAAKDELFQLTMETLTAMLTESFAGSNELLSMLMEGLTAYLVESNAIRNELSQALMSNLIETLNMLSSMQQSLMMTMFSTLIVQLMTCFTVQWALLTSMITLLLTQITMNFTMLSIISASILTGITIITASILAASTSIVQGLGSLLAIIATEFAAFFGKYVNDGVEDKQNTIKSLILAEDANRLAKFGNDLAKVGNIQAAAGNGLAVAQLLLTEQGLILLAMPDLLKMTGAGAAVTALGALTLAGALAAFAVATAATGIQTFMDAPTTYSYAEGGIPGYGELFIAREAGPEFVGSFGSRNVVMNNNQIVDAVSGGVYDAVRRANAEQSQQPIYLNVEAKVRENVLFDMMEKVRAERGVRLSTGGAWYKNSIQNGLFHIGTEMLKGEVRQSRTVALATSGQKYNSISLFTYHVSLSMKGGDTYRQFGFIGMVGFVAQS